MRKRLIDTGSAVFIVIVILIGFMVYSSRVYFFNRLTFHNDIVINLPYEKYRNPLYMEYDFIRHDTTSASPTWYRSAVTNRNEMLQVLRELQIAGPSLTQPDRKLIGNEGTSYIFLRQQVFATPRPPSPILLTVRIYNKQGIMEILQPNGVQTVIRSVPQTLVSLLKSEEKEAAETAMNR